MCNKSSCIQCHSKSHCQEFAKNKQIAKLERTIEHLNRRIEDEELENNQVIDELLKEIESMKSCANCKECPVLGCSNKD